jgi:hypothetical protein
VDIEFLDPGPDQPDGDADGPAQGDSVSRPPVRETVGLLIMLCAAALLPVVASFQSLYAVREQGPATEVDFTVDAWGRYGFASGPFAAAAHAPRFGILLAVSGAGFAVLALLTALRLLGARTRAHTTSHTTSRASSMLVGAAVGLVGLLVGVTAAMTLEIESVFSTLRDSSGGVFGGPLEVSLRIGAASWLSLAAVLAGALAVAAALRVRSAEAAAASAENGPDHPG